MQDLLSFPGGGTGLQRIVELAHRHLGFDSVAVCELRGDEIIIRASEPFQPGFGMVLDQPYSA